MLKGPGYDTIPPKLIEAAGWKGICRIKQTTDIIDKSVCKIVPFPWWI